MKTCSRHSRYNCTDYSCTRDRQTPGTPDYDPTDNAGSLSFTSDGGLGIGLGGGLALDTSNGEIGFQVGGITFD